MKRREFLRLVGLSIATLTVPVMTTVNHGTLYPTFLFNRRISKDEIQALYIDPYAPLKFDGTDDYIFVNKAHSLSRGLVGGIVYDNCGKGRFIKREVKREE